MTEIQNAMNRILVVPAGLGNFKKRFDHIASIFVSCIFLIVFVTPSIWNERSNFEAFIAIVIFAWSCMNAIMKTTIVFCQFSQLTKWHIFYELSISITPSLLIWLLLRGFTVTFCYHPEVIVMLTVLMSFCYFIFISPQKFDGPIKSTDLKTINIRLALDNLPGLDLGTGMAMSYCHGYLKLMLKSSDQCNGILQNMKDYEDKNNVTFEAQKLFILFPKSMACPPSIETDDAPKISQKSTLNAEQVSRAGTRDRVYKNAVYSITTENRSRKYVCMEYATPLESFREALKTPMNEYQKIFQSEMVDNFYNTLQILIRQNELESLCELIYYDDVDANGRTQHVGNLILHRLEKLS